MKTLTISRPDDWHLHLRDGEMLNLVAPLSNDFGRAIIMPNLVPPVRTLADAQNYHERIKATGTTLTPLMTLYLTEHTTPDDIKEAHASGIVHAVKLYPAGATTNSSSGVKDISTVMNVLETMAELGMILCTHGEVTNPEIDIFDREAVFIDTVLDPLRRKLPELKIVSEHITTSQAVDYVKSANKNLAATITTHHLIIDRNDMLVGGIKPHFYCLPIAKRSRHKSALRQAAISGDQRFFLGTDSAPHPRHAKEAACGCAGVFSAPNTIPWLAQVFEEEDALDKLEGFASEFGPKYYGLPVNSDTVTLERNDTPIKFPAHYGEGDTHVVLFDPNRPLLWRVKTQRHK